MNTENQKLKLLLAAEALEERTKLTERREAAVEMLLKNLNSSSEWLQKQAIQLLFFYRDMPVVRSRLEAFRSQLSLESRIHKTLEEFFNGTLDVSSILKFREQQRVLDEKIKRIKYELELEKNESTGLGSSTFSHLDLVSLKQN